MHIVNGATPRGSPKRLAVRDDPLAHGHPHRPALWLDGRPRDPTRYKTPHTFGTQAIAGGANVHDLQRWMGHRHLATTMRYVHYRPQGEDADLLGHRFAGAAGELDALLGDSAEARIGIPPCTTDDDLMRRETTPSASS